MVFVLDASTSIWGPDFDKQLSFVQDVIGEFDIRPTKTRCGLLTFSDGVRVEFGLDTYWRKDELQRAVGSTRQLLGGTRTDLALARMRKLFEAEHRRAVPKLAIVLTDGESTYTDMTGYEAKLARQEGITVFAIGIGHSVNRKELEKIASSEDYVFEVDTFDALKSIRKLLTIRACSVEEAGQSKTVTPPTKGKCLSDNRSVCLNRKITELLLSCP